jgi:hypothetical protein
LRWLGYVPASPDGSVYRFDRQLGQVVNERHGSVHEPELRPSLLPTAPINQLMDRYRTLRTDLKFREDGIHTTVTLEK